jgi:hypothetical protein
MQLQAGALCVFSMAAAQLMVTTPVAHGNYIEEVGTYEVGDVSLTPGVDESKLNLAWTTQSEGRGECVVQIANSRSDYRYSSKYYGFKTPGHHRSGKNKSINTFSSETAQTDDGIVDYYYCKVEVSGLKNHAEYIYRMGDNNGSWTETYEYSTENTKKYGFIYLADAQIGAGKEGLDADISGWANTVDLIYEYFPESAFILSAGDQIETPGDEEEWDGFLSPFQHSSPLPVAPASANHDQSMRGNYSEGFIYHFNLPNESERFSTTVDLNGCSSGGPGGAPPEVAAESTDTEDECTPDYADIELAGDYYFTYGDVLYMVLNMDSTDYAVHQTFMEGALEAHPEAKWRVAMWHYTIYTAASRSAFVDVSTMSTMMEDLNIDVVFMGHDHTYCRTFPLLQDEVQEETFNESGESIDPEGVVYFTANSASGSKYYNLASDVADREYIAAYGQPEVPMFSYVEVTPGSFSVTTYVTDTMEEVDSYTIRKTDNSSKHGKKR